MRVGKVPRRKYLIRPKPLKEVHYDLNVLLTQRLLHHRPCEHNQSLHLAYKGQCCMSDSFVRREGYVRPELLMADEANLSRRRACPGSAGCQSWRRTCVQLTSPRNTGSASSPSGLARCPPGRHNSAHKYLAQASILSKPSRTAWPSSDSMSERLKQRVTHWEAKRKSHISYAGRGRFV